ncbi:HAD family hydrolase [Streptomyces sp. RPT161]|uniref:HAD family hydrolase n=1 Tax=Streptomyces sp. RPT161 TaxID=3015993 RepID=UPI0022B86516|nr:HAD-IIB family hydrolase [Streptomyces sp. RPT161]
MADTHHSGCPRARGGSRPAVVVTDLDYTLLRSDGTVSERAVAVLREAAADGARIVFATARPAWSARTLLAAASGMNAALVSSNGAVVSELDSGRVLRTRAMAPSTARAAIARLGWDTWAADRENDRLLGPGWPDVLASGAATAERVATLPDGAAILCVMVHGGTDVPPEALGRRGDVVWTSSSPGLLEISAPEADKVCAVQWILDDAGIGWGEVVAFGDAPNDAGLLAAAGLGVAVANACPQILALADAVTRHHDDEGVAKWLEGECLCPA